MRHLDLFSGLGSWALAARHVWGEEYECIGFCETDWFCRQVLAKNFPGVPIYGDIKTITNTTSTRLARRGPDTEGQSGQPYREWGDQEPFGDVQCISGSFPCQSFSCAGRRRGTADDRWLWPAMFNVVRYTNPEWVIAENVFGFTTWQQGLALEEVCTDLESENYEVQSFVIPAAGVGAPHRRDRVWIVAHSLSGGRQERLPLGEAMADAHNMHQWDSWEQDWHEVASRLCRVDARLPKRVVRFPDGTVTSEGRWRREALKAYGNSICPQVAVEIMKAIKAASRFST